MVDTINEIGKREHAALGSEMFWDLVPCRWIDSITFRCPNDHVSKMILRCDDGGPRDRCLACHEPTNVTFPEDKDGPLDIEAAAKTIIEAQTRGT